MRAPLISFAIVVGLAGSARADPSDDESPWSPAAATWLSVGATTAGYATIAAVLATGNLRTRGGSVALAFGGTVALTGPSLGRVYAGNYSGSGAFYLRLGAFPVALVGLFVVASECAEIEPCPGHPKGNAVYGTALAMIAAGTIWELLTVGEEARRQNRRWRKAPVALVPSVTTSDVGLAVQGRF